MSRRRLAFCAILCGCAVSGRPGVSPASEPSSSGRKSQPAAAVARFHKALAEFELVDFPALEMAIRDLAKTFPERYPDGASFLRRSARYAERSPRIRDALRRREEAALAEAAEVVAFQREALLANPLLDFDRLLLIKRKPIGDPRRPEAPDKGYGEFLGLPKQSSWQLQTMPNVVGWENEIAVLSPVRPEGKLTTLYRPPARELLSDVDLHYDADRLLFSMPDGRRRWQLFEIGIDGTGLRRIDSIDYPDVHNFDACYLPGGKIAFLSTAMFQGVPCNDGVTVAMLYVMDADGRNVRQLCFEQDHDYCPTVTNDGRILYLRWDYTDLPHNWSRILFTMNPDGTGQREYYASNSYWPSAIFYARPVPGHPTKVAGIVTGHHVGRVGELVVFDPALGRHEVDGVVQRIPGRGEKVLPLIEDKLTLNSWPKFVHPFPLSEKYFIVSCKPTPTDLWGIYLVDVFDNLVLLKEIEGHALLEPIPVRKTRRPPDLPHRVDLARGDALVYLEDAYAGPGLKGVPRGTVKRLRLFTYHFAYQYQSGGQHRVGTDGPWEPKRVLGTVPVEEDGSAFFRVPANVPISIQPLDAEGKAVQLMRSWTTAMPGETVSCTGCHERQNGAPPGRATIAARRAPSEIEPWSEPTRGFSFDRDVRPVVDRYCVGCHDGGNWSDGRTVSDLRKKEDEFVVFGNNDPVPKTIEGVAKDQLTRKYAGVFEPAYVELRRFVRVPGLESDLHLQPPGEFAANTSELVQMLRKGHYGVRLDREAWDRLVTWIDLNAPCYGTWREVVGAKSIKDNHAGRRKLLALYGDVEEDPELDLAAPGGSVKPIVPPALPREPVGTIDCEGWPFDANEARRRQIAAARTLHRGIAHGGDDGPEVGKTIDLGKGVGLDLVLIPAGKFIMGDPGGCADERPLGCVAIESPFWMGSCEITNEQYAVFDPAHNSRFEHGAASAKTEEARGPRLNDPKQPVVRVSWKDAVAFCRWLSKKTGRRVTLPTEAQWEYACRAGTNTPLYYGGPNADFSQFANVADATMGRFATWSEKRRCADIIPRDARSNDGALVTAGVGQYRPNAWGLHDMHGNVWEWTRSTYRSYPCGETDSRNELAEAGERSVRGGSWSDRPERCRSAFRLSYPAWQKVYNVGFRVVVEAGHDAAVIAATDGGFDPPVPVNHDPHIVE